MEHPGPQAIPEPETCVPALDSTSIMELDEVPDHLLVLGGGYIGLEFGQMFRRFGSRVTIVQRAGQLLPREDPDVAEEITKILREDEVDVLLNATAPTSCSPRAGFRTRTISTFPRPASGPTKRVTYRWTAGCAQTSPTSTPRGT